ncbi:MAG: hypothetical protein DRJ03_18505 [Chloroflexi bacterium]|nr:MAG: hypothetical protein DRJ03_18505 [Chloroflexota bacterium]
MSNPTPKVPISICLIAKNERKNIDPFWKSVKGLLQHPEDEVVMVDTGSMDGTTKRARELGWKVILRPDLCTTKISELGKKWKPELWEKYSKHCHFKDGLLGSFAKARQISFDAAKNKMCIWLDLDDDLINGHHLRPLIDSAVEQTPKGKGSAIFLRYDYSFDVDGVCNTSLWRERVVHKDHFYWKGLCHETLLPKGEGHTIGRDVNCPTVVSHRNPKEHEFSDLRNYIILRKDLEVDRNHDPRTLFYLGNACRGLKKHKEAVDWYHMFMDQSGSRDDVMAARINKAYCLSELDLHWQALKECKESQLVNSNDPRAFYTEAGIWAKLENWDNVITAVKLGDQLKLADTMHAIDPTTLHFQPALLLVKTYREKQMPEAAMQAAYRLAQSSPNSSAAKAIFEDTQKWARAEVAGMGVFQACAHAKNPQEAAKQFNISPHFLDRGIRDYEKEQPGDLNKTTITFYCGQSATRWGPPSTEKGIGASEKMVYEAARRLAKKGHNVQVYCRLNRPEGVCEEGIHWYYSGRFDPANYRDVLIIWRMPDVVNKIPFECGKLFVWMHDVGYDGVWTNATLQKIDKVFFLSEYQRSLHPSVPDDKVYLTRNGIDLTQHIYNGQQKEKKIIFMSSPDRGWLTAIQLFKESKLAEQGYKLHMFYGFGEIWKEQCAKGGWGHIVEMERDMRMYVYEDWCRVAAMQTPGVIYRGSVGWKEMAEEIKTAEIWLYPTKFQEISCVAAMEAMAAGCKCVATDHAALTETLKGYPGWFLVDLEGDNPHQAIANAANTWFDPKVGAEFATKFDMDKLIDAWDKDLMEVEDDFRPDNNRGPTNDGEKRFSVC